MLFQIGNHSLNIEHDPFQITISRQMKTLPDQIVLRSTAHPDKVTGFSTGDSSLTIEFAHHNLLVSWQNNVLHLHSDSASENIRLAFELTGHWYGHGELIHQLYPLEKLMLPESPLITFDNGPDGQSCKLTPAWFSSMGILVQAHSPLHVGINQPPKSYPQHTWSLGAEKSPFSERPFAQGKDAGDGLLTLYGPGLDFSIYLETDALTAWRKLVEITGHPIQTPPAELFIKPTWTTWARYKTVISQETVLDFARQIIEQQFPYNVMEIDDRWQTFYGDISFDPGRFPDPRAMIDQLHTLGFKVTAWVIPFLDPASQAYTEGKRHGYLLRDAEGSVCLTDWWQGRGALIDVSNPDALVWFQDRLERLQKETGLDGYKFDAGEAAFYPSNAQSTIPMQPNDYTHHYIQFISEHFSLTEARSAWYNQAAPIFFRQWDKWSTWGLDNGLHSVLTGILALGLTGYPFILPDMVGGNAYDEQASAELMIRWTQLNALLPAMQFSLAPWDYGEECTRICRQYAKLHLNFAAQILQLANESAQNGTPIIRPVWWLATQDERALTCNDEFLLGNDILVAPVLLPGATQRDIYFPPGKWRDFWNGTVYSGDTLLCAYPVSLESLPIFERQPE